MVLQRYDIELHGDVVSVDSADAHAHDVHRIDGAKTQRDHIAGHTRSVIVASTGCTGAELGDASSARVALEVEQPTHVGLVLPGARVMLRPGSALALFSPHESYVHRRHLHPTHPAHSYLTGHNCSWSPNPNEAKDHQVAMRVMTMRVVSGGHEGSDQVCGVGTCLVELTGPRTDAIHSFRRASIEYELVPPSDQDVDARMAAAGVARRRKRDETTGSEPEWDQEFETTLMNFNYDEEKERATQSLRFTRLVLKSPLTLASLSGECVDCYYYATRGTKLRMEVGWSPSEGPIIELFRMENYGESRLHVQFALRLWLGLQPFRFWGNLMPDIVLPKFVRGVPPIPFLILGPVRFYGLFVFGLNLQTAIEFSGMLTGSFGFEKRTSWSETMTYRTGMKQPMVTREEDDTGLQWLPLDFSASAERFVSGTRSDSNMPLVVKIFGRLVVFSSFKLGIGQPAYGLIPYMMIGPEFGISVDSTDRCDLQFDLYKRYAIIVGVTIGKELYLWDRKDSDGNVIRGQKSGGLGLRFGFETFLDIFDDYAPFAIHRIDCPLCSSCLTRDPAGDLNFEIGSWMDFSGDNARAAWDALNTAEQDRATALFAMSPVSATAQSDLSFADSIGSTKCRSADTDSCAECGALAANGCVWCMPSEAATEQEGACVEEALCDLVQLNAQCELPSALPPALIADTTAVVENRHIVLTMPRQHAALDGSQQVEMFLRPEQTEEHVAAFRAREAAIDIELVPFLVRTGILDEIRGATVYRRMPWDTYEPFLTSPTFGATPLTGEQTTASFLIPRSFAPGRYEVLVVVSDIDDEVGTSAREFVLEELIEFSADDISFDFQADNFVDVLYSPLTHCSHFCGRGQRTRHIMCVTDEGVELPFGVTEGDTPKFASCIATVGSLHLSATTTCSTGLVCPEHDLIVEDPSASSSILMLPGVPVPFALPEIDAYESIDLTRGSQPGVDYAARAGGAVDAAHAAGEAYELGIFRTSISKAAPYSSTQIYLVECQGKIAQVDTFEYGTSSRLLALRGDFFRTTHTIPGRYAVVASGSWLNGGERWLKFSSALDSFSTTSATLLTVPSSLHELTKEGRVSIGEPMYISHRVHTLLSGVLRAGSPVPEPTTIIGYVTVEGSAGHVSIDIAVNRITGSTVLFSFGSQEAALPNRRIFVRLLPEAGFTVSHDEGLIFHTTASVPILESLEFKQYRPGTTEELVKATVNLDASYDRSLSEEQAAATALSFEFDLLDKSLWAEWFGPDSLDEECVWADALQETRRRKLKAGYAVDGSGAFRETVGDEGTGLSTVALAAIVAGACLCVALVAAACAGVLCIARRKRSVGRASHAHGLATSMSPAHGGRSQSFRHSRRASGSYRHMPRTSPTMA